MRTIETWTEFLPHASAYMRACVQTENYSRGWHLAKGAAVLVDGGDEYRLLIDGECTPLEYVRILTEAASSSTPAASANIPFDLAQQLKPEKSRDWYYLERTSPRASLALPAECAVVLPGKMDQEISRFIQLNASDSSVVPGNPEIDFWIVAHNSENEIIATAAGTTWSSGIKVVASVAVGIGARRQGWGSVVTMLALQQHFELGASTVGLGVRGSNMGAVEMYRSLGFEDEYHYSSIRLITTDLE
jgi:hypothetical protein